jgi:hypothetical protein
MLSEADVAMLTHTLGISQRSAENLEKVFGPTVVYNRDVLAKRNAETPERSDSEWVDEQVGLYNKYGAMSLAVRRLEDGLQPAAGTGNNEALIVQAASNELADKAVADILAAASSATIVLGGRADRLHPQLAEFCGVQVHPPPGSDISCEVTPANRLSCGFSGITHAECTRRGCCFDNTHNDAAWCFENSLVADAGFVQAAFNSPLAPELQGMHNLSMPRHIVDGLDGTAGVAVTVPCSDPLMALGKPDPGAASAASF